MNNAKRPSRLTQSEIRFKMFITALVTIISFIVGALIGMNLLALFTLNLIMWVLVTRHMYLKWESAQND